MTLSGPVIIFSVQTEHVANSISTSVSLSLPSPASDASTGASSDVASLTFVSFPVKRRCWIDKGLFVCRESPESPREHEHFVCLNIIIYGLFMTFK